METDVEGMISSDYFEAHSTRKSIGLSIPLMKFLPLSDKNSRRSGSDAGGMAFSNARNKWSGRYERIDEEIPWRKTMRKASRRKRSTKTLKLRSSNKRTSRRFRIFRLRLKWVSPILLLKGLRDAYVRMMIKIANSGYMASLSKTQPYINTLYSSQRTVQERELTDIMAQPPALTAL